MRKAILFIIFMVLCSCVMEQYQSMWDFNLDVRFRNEQEVGKWIDENIEYEKDDLDYWRTPQETIDERKGDCEDQALLYIGICYQQFGKCYDLQLVDTTSNGIVNHAIVEGLRYGENGRSYKVIQSIGFNNIAYELQFRRGVK